VDLKNPSTAEDAPQSPVVLDWAGLEKRVGVGRSMKMVPGIENHFPKASQWIGGERVRALAGLSTLVGMECPGLHSIFLGFSVAFGSSGPEALSYSLASLDDRFRRLKMTVQGPGLQGTVDAALRRPPET